jgi:hypothetical protein
MLTRARQTRRMIFLFIWITAFVMIAAFVLGVIQNHELHQVK